MGQTGRFLEFKDQSKGIICLCSFIASSTQFKQTQDAHIVSSQIPNTYKEEQCGSGEHPSTHVSCRPGAAAQ